MTILQEEHIYPSTFIYQGKERTLLWATSNRETSSKGDYFKTKENGILYIANNIQDAKEKFAHLPFNIFWFEAATIDFDIFWNELNKLDQESPADEKACKIILDGWNFIEDLLRTFSLNDLREKLNDLQINKAYKKFFWGCNIEAVTPKGSGYNPLWEDDELSKLRENLLYVWKEVGEKTQLW